jgi:hypothetical protein
MERAIVIGDPHFREGAVLEMDLFIEETLRIIGENRSRADYIVVLGDIMDRHGILHQKPFHQSCKFLIDLAKLLPTYCLIGNHDFDIPSKYLPDNHPFKLMTWTTIPNLTIVDKPIIIRGKFFCPYVPPGMFNRAIGDAIGRQGWEALVEGGVGLVYAHQEFKGCHMGRVISETGDDWPGEFGRGPFVVSGHIHDHQMVGENIMYVGTPVQVNFGEGKKMGICLFTMEYTDERLPMRYTKEWFPIRVSKKVTKNIDVESLDSWVENRFDSLLHHYQLALPKPIMKRDESKAFEFIQRLHGTRDKLTELGERIKTDRYADQYKLQILVRNPISNTVLKNTTVKLKELPLGIHHIFITNLSSEIPEEKDPETPEEKGGWFDQYLNTVKTNPEKERILLDVLKQLTEKRGNHTRDNLL